MSEARVEPYRPTRGESAAIVIVNWNGGELLHRCLDAVSAQTVAPARVLVVDNASTDRSCDNLAARYPQVELIRLDRNVGFAAANNVAASRATDCKWLALLNPDAFPDPRWLEQLLLAASRHPDDVCFGSRLLQADAPQMLDGVGDVYHFSGLVWREARGRTMSARYLEEREIFSPCAAAALYRRDVFVALGGFDEDYFCYVEDVDFGFRLRLMGHRCLYVPGAVVLHKGSALSGRRSDFAIYHGHRNLMWTFVKNMPGALFWLLLPVHLIVEVMTVLLLACLGHGRVALKAKIDALRGLPHIWKKRTALQSARVVRPVDLARALHLSIRRSDLSLR